ncbi:hypothetical protein VF21_01127 [Pseudogymnoascus sp. 05NY08]|nr:hypothetical protein VF21_01127 [Pseudogymnoascus sp. 05NY08]
MASTPTAHIQPSAEKSQYHHFIPRFILRNFSYKPPKNGNNKRGKGNGRKQYVEDMLHTIDLSGPTAKIVDTTVARTLGKVDMYRDFAKAENQQGLEKQLAGLESLAGRIVAKIRKGFEAGDKDAWITRLERDTLRKFLFIMKYRSSNMHKRFSPETFEDYSADDREELLEYIRGKNFEKPIDVWFDNIKAMLELEMDPGADAEWFVHHTQSMFMALCTPSEQDDEFLLTENGYGIHEGPVSGRVDPSTGEFTATSYTEYHVFAVISPRLMIVLRSFILPDPMEDNLQGVREFRQIMYQMCASTHANPNEAHSILADLPISKATNSYTKLMGGRLVLLNGEDGSHRANHRFCFRFFPVATDHVDRINGIMLEESYGISTIVFGSRTGAQKILESYLSAPLPAESSAESSFKTVSGKPDDPRFIFLQKLEHVAKQMGSNVVAVYCTRNNAPTEEEEYEEVARVMELTPTEERGEHMQLYMRLGGSYATLMKDMEQARNMMNMRIKFDVWSTGLNEHIRNNIRENFQRIFSQLPVRRVWYYLKHVRNIALRDRSIEGSVICEGPEDVIAKVSHVIRSEDIARLMFAVILNQISLAHHPDLEFYPTIISEASWRSISRSKQIAFSLAGSICDCGINEIEQKARLVRDKLKTPSYLKTFASLFLPKDAMIRNPLWSDEENIEMRTRFHTRIVFPGLVAKLAEEEEDELDEVLFDIAYPCPSPFYVFNSEKKTIQAYQWINSMLR